MTGSGTEADPYIIYTVEDLQAVSSDLLAYYELGANIDASNTINWNGGKGFMPIGDSSHPFGGSFHGRNYTISDLYINNPDLLYVGLFAAITYATAVVRNLNLTDVYVEGSISNARVGGLTGRVGNTGWSNLYSIYVTGTVKGRYVGGIVGYAQGLNCYDSYFSGTLVQLTGTSSTGAGGFVGTANSAKFYRCGTAGTLTGPSRSGGFVGDSQYGEFYDCFSHVSVTASVYAGGFVSHVFYQSNFVHCFATGKIIAGTRARGFACSVAVTYTCIFENNYWDKITSGCPEGYYGTNPDVVGYTTAEMKVQSNFELWDFDTVWLIKEDETYPFLRYTGKYILVVAPTEMEAYKIYNITYWYYQVSNVKIEISFNNGATWYLLVSSIAATGVYQWFVSILFAVPECKIKITDVNYPDVYDTSNTFAILPPNPYVDPSYTFPDGTPGIAVVPSLVRNLPMDSMTIKYKYNTDLFRMSDGGISRFSEFYLPVRSAEVAVADYQNPWLTMKVLRYIPLCKAILPMWPFYSPLSTLVSAGDDELSVDDGFEFQDFDKLLLFDQLDGKWEILPISTVSGTTIIVSTVVSNSYPEKLGIAVPIIQGLGSVRGYSEINESGSVEYQFEIEEEFE